MSASKHSKSDSFFDPDPGYNETSMYHVPPKSTYSTHSGSTHSAPSNSYNDDPPAYCFPSASTQRAYPMRSSATKPVTDRLEDWDGSDEEQRIDPADTVEAEDRLLDEELQWARRPVITPVINSSRLEVRVLVPQSHPDLQATFMRAWAPILSSHDVRMSEFVQFIDHLNVVKMPSPPLQALSLAGSVVGFVPNHWAQLAGGLTQLTSGIASYAVSRLRIKRYLERANKTFFFPRGLRARIVKGPEVSQAIGMGDGSPALGDVAGDATVRERMMAAMADHIAPLQFDNLPPPSKEMTKLDQLSSKMVQKKQTKDHNKLVKERSKDNEDVEKEERKMREELIKLDEEEEKVHRKAEEEMRKKPEEAGTIRKEKEKELRNIDKDRRKATEEYGDKAGEGGKKEGKKAKKLLFILVEDVDQAALAQQYP